MEPTISVGVPTYNRAKQLKVALDHITRQTYRKLDIVVSDNASTDETPEMVTAMAQRDPRIRFFRHPENRGTAFNFDFVLRQATSHLFMWAADDDRWESSDLIERLSRFAESHTLTFPDCHLMSQGKILERSHLRCYGDCATSADYLRRWCAHGTGYPFYGVYNRRKMDEDNLSFVFDNDIAYYNEGTFLHRLFLTGKVKFVPDVFIAFSINSAKPNAEKMLQDFKTYFARTLLVYRNSALPAAELETVYSLIIDNYTNQLADLQALAAKGGHLRRSAKELKAALRWMIR
jgi:glycosyltransferase involved in cell wall biosynthesis